MLMTVTASSERRRKRLKLKRIVVSEQNYLLRLPQIDMSLLIT